MAPQSHRLAHAMPQTQDVAKIWSSLCRRPIEETHKASFQGSALAFSPHMATISLSQVLGLPCGVVQTNGQEIGCMIDSFCLATCCWCSQGTLLLLRCLGHCELQMYCIPVLRPTQIRTRCGMPRPARSHMCRHASCARGAQGAGSTRPALEAQLFTVTW